MTKRRTATKPDEYREWMVTALHTDQAWQRWADGYMSCPVCGALIHPAYRQTHEAWHERNNA